MEVATAPQSLLAQRRVRTFERECERLRPLGEAYVARRFGGSLNKADAEDVVAEVLIRLHKQSAKGEIPRNLRAAFFTSVRNAAIDLLRARSARPTVALEAAADATSVATAPDEWAEGREDAMRLQEALGRMRTNYREAILLRFGLGLTVPEMAKHLSISLPAAKKLVLRATRQVAQRMEAIEDEEFCPEMRDLARESLFEREATGLSSDAESEVLRTHFMHCGSCKSFLSNLQGTMHDLGGAAVLGLGGAKVSGAGVGVLDGVGSLPLAAFEGLQVGLGRMREAAYRLTSALPGSDVTSAGALLGTGQKIAAICTAGAATATTCLLTGAVGPGIGASGPPERPPAQTREATAPVEAPPPVVAVEAEPEPTVEKEAPPPSKSEQSGGEGVGSGTSAPAQPAPVEESDSAAAAAEFGVEPTASPPPEASKPAPAPKSSSGGGSSDFGGGGGGSSGGGASGGSSGAGTAPSGVGFQG